MAYDASSPECCTLRKGAKCIEGTLPVYLLIAWPDLYQWYK